MKSRSRMMKAVMRPVIVPKFILPTLHGGNTPMASVYFIIGDTRQKAEVGERYSTHLD
jgi:hypothetical protein